MTAPSCLALATMASHAAVSAAAPVVAADPPADDAAVVAEAAVVAGAAAVVAAPLVVLLSPPQAAAMNASTANTANQPMGRGDFIRRCIVPPVRAAIWRRAICHDNKIDGTPYVKGHSDAIPHHVLVQTGKGGRDRRWTGMPVVAAVWRRRRGRTTPSPARCTVRRRCGRVGPGAGRRRLGDSRPSPCWRREDSARTRVRHRRARGRGLEPVAVGGRLWGVDGAPAAAG